VNSLNAIRNPLYAIYLSACLPESHQKIASALNTRLFTGISLGIFTMTGYPIIICEEETTVAQ